MSAIISTGRGPLLTIFCMVIFVYGFSQPLNKKPGASKPVIRETENIVMIALDGMRWQEIFGGLDSNILHNPKFTRDLKDLKEKFWAEDKVERRKRLMPFLWTTIANHGQLYGNPEYGNYV